MNRSAEKPWSFSERKNLDGAEWEIVHIWAKIEDEAI